jgi:hypothetical protein
MQGMMLSWPGAVAGKQEARSHIGGHISSTEVPGLLTRKENDTLEYLTSLLISNLYKNHSK